MKRSFTLLMLWATQPLQAQEYTWRNFAGNPDLAAPLMAGSLSAPGGLARTDDGTIYVADTGNHVIRKILADEAVTTVAGKAGIRGTTDGPKDNAFLDAPASMVVDSSGNLFFTDKSHHTLRKLNPATGVTTTFIGLSGVPGNTDSSGSNARLHHPEGLAILPDDTLLVADTGNSSLRMVSPQGVTSTFAHLQMPCRWVAIAAEGAVNAVYTAGGGKVFRVSNGGSSLYHDASVHGDILSLATNGLSTVFFSQRGRITRLKKDGSTEALPVTQAYCGDLDLTHLAGLSVDPTGKIWGCSTSGHTVHELTYGAAVTTLAGRIGTSGFIDGTGDSARFGTPVDIAVTPSGGLIVADSGYSVIRRVSPAGEVSTLAGSGVRGYTDGDAAVAQFANPQGVATDSQGNVFVADTGNGKVRRISPQGVVSTLGDGTSFRGLRGLTVDATGTIYVVATDDKTVWKIHSDGSVAALADQTGSPVQFLHPTSVAIEASGSVLVTDGSVISRIAPTGEVSIVAGSWTIGDLLNDGPATTGKLNSVKGLTIRNGNALFTERQQLREITEEGLVLTLAGNPGPSTPDIPDVLNGSGNRDGFHRDAAFAWPHGVAATQSGLIYFADSSNRVIRKAEITWRARRLAGINGLPGSTGNPYPADGLGAAARFHTPRGIAVSNAGNVYVTDTAPGTIRKINGYGLTSTHSFITPGCALGGLAVSNSYFGETLVLAQTGLSAIRRADYLGKIVTSNFGGQILDFVPSDISLAGAESAYASDPQGNTIRLVSSSGGVQTVAGMLGQQGSQNGSGQTARFKSPSGIAVYGQKAVVADTGNHTIRLLEFPDIVTTMAGIAETPGSADGSGSAARFHSPAGVALDAAGNVFVADQGNHTIRMISPDGNVRTIGGLAGNPGSRDGEGSQARFRSPAGIAVDASGLLYVADSGNRRISLGRIGLSPLEEWREEHFGHFTNSGPGADQADADGDGVPNLCEWACGTDPMDGMGGAAWLEQPYFYFQRSKVAAAAGAVLQLQWSRTLAPGSWVQHGETYVRALSPEIDLFQVSFPSPASGTRFFFRLQVTAPPPG